MSNDFAALLSGRLQGVLTWSALDALWTRLRAMPEGWYVSLSGHVPGPEQDAPLSVDAFERFISELDTLLRREHDEDYCGIVYVDDPEQPSFIKIYDPGNLGSSCGMQAARFQPRWVLSRVRPEAIEDAAPLPANRRRWWQTLFGGAA